MTMMFKDKTLPPHTIPNLEGKMGTTLQLSSHNLASLFLSHNFINNNNNPLKSSSNCPSHQISFTRRVFDTKLQESAAAAAAAAAAQDDESPGVTFAFVSSVLLPDGTPDVHYRRACGGQKLRDIMLDNNVELYGPYSRPLLNCAGGGTCGTCMVEVVDGKEILSPKTDKEKAKLKRKPKNWRLACQSTVGNPDSTGLIVIQQLPEWKAHEWTYTKNLPQPQGEEEEIK